MLFLGNTATQEGLRGVIPPVDYTNYGMPYSYRVVMHPWEPVGTARMYYRYLPDGTCTGNGGLPWVYFNKSLPILYALQPLIGGSCALFSVS